MRAIISSVAASKLAALASVLSNNGFRKSGNDYCGAPECLPNLLLALEGNSDPFDLVPIVPFLQSEIEKCNERYSATIERIERLESAGNVKLWNYQFNDVLKMSEAKSTLNCSAVGTGKTISVLFTLPSVAMCGNAISPEAPRVLVVCPTAAFSAWKTQTAAWRPDLTVVALKGTQSFRMPLPGEMLIVSYDSLPHLRSECLPGKDLDEYFKDIKGNVYLIGDEVHYCKSFKASRTRRFRSLSLAVLRKGGVSIGLTGTPIVNKPNDLWCLLQNHNLTKETFGSWDSYCEAMGGYKNRFGGYEWGAQRSECSELLAKVMIRNTLEEVFPDMPSKIKEPHWVDLEDAVLRSKLDEVWKEVEHLSNDEVMERLQDISFASLTRVREKLASFKLAATLELIKDLEENEEPVIVVSCYKKPIEKIGKRKGWRYITGDVSSDDREEIVKELNAGVLKGIALTSRAAGLSLNLQRAHRMIIIDRDVTEAANTQVEGRIHRIGQLHPCLYTYIMVNHPWEQRVNEILEEKMGVRDAVIEPIKSAANRRVRKSELLSQVLARYAPSL